MMQRVLFRLLSAGIILLSAAAFPGTGQANESVVKFSDQGQPWQDMEPGNIGSLLFSQSLYPSFDYGDPTAAEQAHLEAINRARLDPYAEAARLGIDLFEGVPSGAISGNPVAPLVMNASILAAARLHSQDMIDNDFFSHYSPDGSSPFDRMTAQGYNYSYAGENIAIVYASYEIGEVEAALENHDNLFIDENYPDRGHRVNILSEDYKEIGVGTGFGEYSGMPYGYTVTCDFGTASQFSGSFILGVVYDDTDADTYYDAGEGLANVTISLSGSATDATTTASAGGYGIPVNAGTYTVTATLSDGTAVQKSVTIDTENQKVDFLKSEFGSGGGSSGTGTTAIGESAGYLTYAQSASDSLSLKVNVTNSAGATPVYEWIWAVLVSGGQQSPVFVLTASGWQTMSDIASLGSLAFDHGANTTYDIGDFSLADLGLGSGDTLQYGYAYSTGSVYDLIIENMVTLNVN